MVVLQGLSDICIYILKWAHQCPKDQLKKSQSRVASPFLTLLRERGVTVLMVSKPRFKRFLKAIRLKMYIHSIVLA